MSVLVTKLLTELQAAGLDVRSVSPTASAAGVDAPHVTVIAGQGSIYWNSTPTAPEEATALAIVAAHDPTDYATAQRDTTAAQARELFADLRKLPPREAAYVGLARLLAVRKGLTIDQAKAVIFNEATATSAVTGSTEWQALPGTVKPFMALFMGAVADSMAVMLLLLGD